ncbi:hypothetical protein C5E08_13840 [Rathayibacter iranicus]|uniref:Uncharacterized protein n=2 Tax=Rathayibacter iranicus TaxID=59737 RepID=A0AAD1AHP6_9MICO|nr:hypothetical protein C7V51_14080 [Rathayibacter iranicus]PPI42515.1 hypothetical protein C5E09_12935 [Rathayibacter iranicus]PPI57931.1 hypothetical protein C5E08_13840 [Rathayibacter iranicus]PPI68867.1 hypothetical protein C5E01_12890 [Rathayibacter iranicus]PWJ59790.1 hypothetical protein B0H03_12811 [Rathayibacter iranicus NCPPB 2253 = VKM Ac-1602]
MIGAVPMNTLEEQLTKQSDSTREITLGGDWVIPAQDGFARRTLVKGAAWSIPVVSLAVATPAAAASNSFVCPTVPASSGWTGASGLDGDSGGTGDYGWTSDGTSWWNTKDATRSNYFSYYIEFPFKGVAGHNYNFSWSAFANGSGNNVSYVAYDVLIGGGGVYTASTDPRRDGGATYLDPDTATSVPASATFTPQIDGNYTFRYRIRLSHLADTQYSNHNVQIKMPTLTCS